MASTCLFLTQFLLIFPVAMASSSPPLILSLLKSTVPNKLTFRRNVSLTVAVAVGSPPQTATMVLDTGSELSWLRCNAAVTTSASASFNPHVSITYRPITCSAPTCTTRTRDLTLPASCDKNRLCHVILSYADASSVEGTLATDGFRLGGSPVQTGAVFGCMESGSSSNPVEDARTTGLMGMNRGQLSFVSQMGFPKFSYCISPRDSPGVLILGAAELPWLPPLNYTPLVQVPPAAAALPYFDRVAYTVRLQGITVAGKLLPIPESVLEPDHTGAGQTMIDSGTQFTFLIGAAYAALRSEFLKQTAGILRPLAEPNFVFQGTMDLCFRIEMRSAAAARLPSVGLVFGGAEMKVAGEKLLYRVAGETRGPDGVYCLTFGNSDLLGVEAYVIGHHHQQDLWMEFDLAKSRVGLAEVGCDSASQRLGL
ncbi:aspartic proteinase PCS1-like [Andrographis paniculata]|uniref:aspartic proteinase PCS1-like n=1 Tax=Andrographis paniculata TaxID=175694 RepID=UPI0021E814A9|nr:aspartic proteinase PCS1-like [Andrographis paniculata]